MEGQLTPRDAVWIRRGFVLALLVTLAYFTLKVVLPFLPYLFMGGLFVYFLLPLHRRIARKVPVRASAGIVLLLFVLALLAPVVWVGVEVTTTATSALSGLDPQEVVDSTDAFLARLSTMVGLEPQNGSTTSRVLNATLPALQDKLEAAVPHLLATAGAIAIGLVVMAFTIYYGLLDGPSLVESVKRTLPLAPEEANHLMSEVRRTVDAVFLGHIIVATIQGVLGGIGFALFGVPNPVFWGFVMILGALIPLVGTPIVWIPGAIYLYATGHTLPAIGLALWCALLVSTLDNVLRPRIIGQRADIHPLLVLVGVLGGISAFGFVGFVTGPLVIAMLVAVVKFWREETMGTAAS